jgi:hypothetical protein
MDEQDLRCYALVVGMYIREESRNEIACGLQLSREVLACLHACFDLLTALILKLLLRGMNTVVPGVSCLLHVACCLPFAFLSAC